MAEFSNISAPSNCVCGYMHGDGRRGAHPRRNKDSKIPSGLGRRSLLLQPLHCCPRHRHCLHLPLQWWEANTPEWLIVGNNIIFVRYRVHTIQILLETNWFLKVMWKLQIWVFLTWIFSVHAIGVELGKPSDMMRAVRIALILCAAIYFAIGIFGYLLFGEGTMDDILVNFDQSSSSSLTSLLNDVVRLSYALHLMLVFPLLNFSLRANIDEFLFSKKPHLAVDNNRFVILTLALLALAYVLAITIPSIWYLFQFMGSTSAVCLAFIFPGAVALRYWFFPRYAILSSTIGACVSHFVFGNLLINLGTYYKEFQKRNKTRIDIPIVDRRWYVNAAR